MKHFISSLASLVLIFCAALTGRAAEDLTHYANPFIGTAATGHTFPGACCPFGLVQASPWTGSVGWQYCTGYVYDDPTIWGFAQTCLNGTGCADLGDVLIQPVQQEIVTLEKATEKEPRTGAFPAKYDKKSETARPGYYGVTYENGIHCEATATEHTGCYRFTFPSATLEQNIYVDLQHNPAWRDNEYFTHITACELNWDDTQTLSGHTQSNIWTEQDVYFVMHFSKPMTGMKERPLRKDERGRKVLVSFSAGGEPLEVQVALSSRSIEGARKNLMAEGGKTFRQVEEQARGEWQQFFERFQLTGTEEQKVSFYTALYHALIQPNNIADNGETPEYSTFSCWDTYRALHPFYTLAFPERVSDLVGSLVTQGERLGHLPIWGLWGKDTYCMIGNHGVSIIAEAYAKGLLSEAEALRAYKAVRQTLTVSHEPKSDWELYTRYGYFPTDKVESESVSRTMECSYDDYAAATMAKGLGLKDDAKMFGGRAEYWQNVFDPTTRFARPRKADGTWKGPFNPSSVGHAESIGGDYTEGNAWQYTFHVQHDVPTLIKLIGGKDAFCQKLDSFFTLKLETTESDVTGLIGQYAHGNEPSHHVAYLYALAGQPERTQEIVRQVCSTLYGTTPDGLSGNDDCGQMSAWLMLSTMGFYPVDPVGGEYVLGAPQMERVVLQLQGGKKLTVEAKGLSEHNKYVRRILWNGKPYKKATISHKQLMQGGRLTFEMTNSLTPSR